MEIDYQAKTIRITLRPGKIFDYIMEINVVRAQS
jgi:hypothetical protein